MSSYTQADTTNYRGWRPLTRWAGRGRGRVRLAGFGQATVEPPPGAIVLPDGTVIVPPDPTQEASWYDVLGQLQEANQRIIALELEIAADTPGGRPGPIAQAISSDVLQARKQYNDLADKFTIAYRAVFGDVPPGLAGLGQFDLVTAAIYAALLGAVIVGLYVLVRYIGVLETRAEATKQEVQNKGVLLNNAAALRQQAAAAQARGDVAGARELLRQAQQLEAQAGSPGPGIEDFGPWFQKNWPWLALGTAAVLTLPQLVRRR